MKLVSKCVCWVGGGELYPNEGSKSSLTAYQVGRDQIDLNWVETLEMLW